MNIIGIVGSVASGKGVVTEYLIKKYGYTSFSLSSLVHDELKKRGITTFTRSTLQDIGDELRKKEGDDVLAKMAIKKLPTSPRLRGASKIQKIIIEGIRNPGEVVYLRTIPGFFLISVDAPQKIRYERVIKRGKPWDPKSWEEFLQVDKRDNKDNKHTNGQQVRECMKLADVHLRNDSDIMHFHEAIKEVLVRPSSPTHGPPV